MRIIIDMQGAQTESRYRGIGRYTMSLTKAIVRNKGEHEIILVLNGLFPETIEPIRDEFDRLLPQENIRVWYVPCPVEVCVPGNEWRREVAERIREAFLASLNPDMVLISSLFEGFIDDAVSSVSAFTDKVPTSVLLYDLIPLLNTELYFDNNPSYAEYYHRQLDYLKKADLLLSISESAALEGKTVLALPSEKIINISTACDSIFKPLSFSEEEKLLFLDSLAIKKPYILYSGSAETRKNLDRLIRAYASMPFGLREKHQLVFAGKISESDSYKLRQVARSSGIKRDQLVLTGYITDEQLVKLYNLCYLFVLPSLHEGFGLPALEAMSCESVVIGSNCTSIPEVIGDDEALFSPYDEIDICKKMIKALTDYEFRDRMVERGKHQVKKFSWEVTAQKALKAIEKKYQNKRKPFDQDFSISQYELLYKELIVQIATLLQKYSNIKDNDFKSIASCLAKNESDNLQVNLSNMLEGTIKWRIEGPFDSSYSLALLNRETARALEKMGHEVILHSTEGPGDFLPNQEFLENNPDLKKFYMRSLNNSHNVCDVVSRILYPPRVNDMSAPMNILHHYAWEESNFPLEWANDFNKYLQGVTCLSNHVQKIMIDSGVTVPLSVTGCGVDHWERVIPDSTYKVKGNNFKFLHVSSCFPRKGADVLLEAYGEAFTSQDDVTLIIKTFPNPHNNIYEELLLIKEKYNNYPDVVIINEDLPDFKLKAIYQDCDVLVAPSKAEGFGLPLAEAILSGLSVITTGWSGQLDFCNEETSWLVDYHFDYAKTHFNLFDSVWAEPDVKDLALKMSEVYELPTEKRMEKTKIGRELLMKKFKWSDVAERLVESAKNFASAQEQPHLRIGWISTWNTRCGIATYSENLINNLNYPVKAILANKTNRYNSADQSYVHRCWSENSQDSLAEAERLIVQLDINTIVIQMNYYFFDFQYLAAFINKQLQEKRLIIIELHSTIDPVNDSRKKLLSLKDCLKKCHRVLVHSPNDMNRLKEIGVIDNVTLFPLGIANIAPSVVNLNIPSKRFIVASYGFFLPNKGIIELIEAFNILLNEGYDIHLLLVNAQYPQPISEKLIKEAKQKIALHNISDHVTLVTDYLKDEESMAYLNKADLVVFPYQKTNESSSAAVRGGLASKKPIAVTPLSIFDDISSTAYYLPGTSPIQIAKGLESYINRLKCNDQLLEDLQISAEKWRSTHLFSSIGRRLQGMLISLYQQNIQNKRKNIAKQHEDNTFSYLEESITQFVDKVDEKKKNTLFDQEVKGLLDKYILDLPVQILKVPRDPFSKEYYDYQMMLHSMISQKRYYRPVENEVSAFKINYDRPFPYDTSEAETIGNQLIAIGFIIKIADLKKNSKILEFGPGWGNTTVQLALSGHKVTAVEIDANFCDLLEYRKKQHKLDNLIIVNQDMVQFARDCNSKDYDAVLFYESFHHCWSHYELCGNINKLLREDGVIIFAAEPILEKCSHFPYPWGVRIDGMSVYSTRKYGWLELGFEMKYFTEMMRRIGFEVKEYKSDVSPLSRILLGRKFKAKLGKYMNY